MISNLHSLKLFNLLSSLFFILTSLSSTWAYSLVGNTLTDLSGTGSYFTDVEAAAWTLSGQLHPPSKTYVCNGTYLLGGYGVLSGTKNGWFQRQYDGLPPHNQISLTVMIWPLDSWDGSATTDDHFEFAFDGVVHYAWKLSGFAGYATKVCGNAGYTDYPPFEARLNIPHTSSSLMFTVISQLDENSENESVGFRDITMTFETVTSPAFTMCGYSPGSPLPTAACDCPQTNQYQNPPNSGSCVDCHATCKTCTGGTSSNCLSCYDGTYLSNNQCITCPANCATCYGSSAASCITCKSTFPYMVNGNQCVADCNYPLVTGMNGTIQTCNTPCPGQYVFSWDSYCSPNCSTILLSPAKYDTFDICNYPCADNQYQYWDAVCDNSCAYPTVPRAFHNKNFCDYPCAISTYSLYWDGTCEQTCPLPLTSQPLHGKILCKYTCADNEYLYWDGSCGATCFYPQIIRFYHNKQFCDFRCATNEYLYWNNSCITTCTFPLVPRYERGVKFCDYPCSGSQYLYWNGSCLATCNSPLVARVVGSSRFCDFPCADNVMLRWDGVCGGTCDSPRIVKTEGYPMVRTFCVFPCADSEYLYWDGTCKSACNPPLVTLVQQNRSFCSYPCASNEVLYWNGSCKSSCVSPLTAKTIDHNNFCYYPCNTSAYLYWDGSCRASCTFPLTNRTEDSRNYCDFPCTGSNYLYWNGSCISTCTLFTPRVDSTKNFCDFQCNPTAYIYWDGACSDTCSSPLTYYTEGSPMVRYFCKFPCATNEILYWNGTCSTTCSFPLVQRTQNSRQFCSLPCTDMTNFVYWNGSCKATCPSPLVTRIDSSGKYCDYPCLGSEYLYWNGSCKALCATPLTSKVINGNNFCYYTCTDTTQYLYWDGTCSSTCNSPLDAVTEGTPSRRFCRFDCNTNEYLYWNGSCIAGCAYPLTSSTSKSRSFCTYPCSASQYLYWDKTCGTSCPYPLTTRVEGSPSSNNYCDFPCSGSNYLYWNSSCSSNCPSPYKTRTQNSKNYCDYPCPTTQYVYSDSSCADTCTSPNVIRVEASRNYCDYPCSSGFLYWNGSCLSTCQSPLKIRYSQGNAYCDYSCSTTQFLYWNGSCFSGCASPLVTRVEASRNYCDYPCQAGLYLYWNGTCGTCPSPLSTQIVAGDKYCNYNCAANQILYWDGSCSTSCLSPRTLVTEGTPARNYCQFSCNTNQNLYWNGTCASSCSSPLVSQTYNSRLFCVYSCAKTEFLKWDGTCVTSCPLPYTYRLEAERNYCDFPCPTGQFLYWNGTCSPNCDSPLTTQTINSRKFCNFPCAENEFAYWDGSCNSTCPSPLAQVIEGDTISRKFCKHTCTTSTDFLYWNGSCASTCTSPLVSQTMKSKKICQFPCDPQSFVYWDGTCLPTCPSPLTSRVEAGMKYCTYGCASNQFLYWNGSCLNYCGSLFIQRTDKNRLFCDYPCGSLEYLYWNGTCMNNCPSPFLSTVQTSIGNRKFCNFPCTTSQFLNWNEVCQDQCSSPYRQDVSTSGRYCYMPCSTSTQYYYPDSGLCNTTCESPYESNNTLPYLQCTKTEVVETETPEETKGPVFTALLMAPTGNGTFTIVKVVKVMQYVRFLKIELPPRLARLGASQGRSILSFQSNSRLLSEKSQVSDLMQSSLPSFFARQGLDSTFIVNFWGNFIFILSTILAAAVLTLFEKCCGNLEWKLLEAIFKRLRVIARWNLFIMLIATNIDDIILYTTIEFKSIHTIALPAVNQFSLAMCVIFLILTAVMLIGMFLLIEKYYKNKKSVSKNTLSLINFDAKWIDMQVVLKGFRSNTLWNRYFYLLYTVRIGFPMVITVCAESVPLLIAIVQALTSILIVLYLIRIKPFKRQINQVQLLIFESLVLMMNLCMFILTVIYISGGQYGDFGTVLGDIVIIGNDLINVITPVFLVIRVLIEAKAIYLYINSLKDKNMIEKTRYLQLIALFFQQANMGFEEVLEDHIPLTTQVTAIPLAKQVGKDFDVSTRRALVSQKTDRNKQDLSMESQRLDDSSRIIVVANASQVFVRSESRKSDDSWLPDISGGYRGQLSESVVTPNRLDESKVVSVDLEGDDLNTSNVGNYKKKLEIVSEDPIKAVIKDHTPTPNFNESVFVFDITKGAEEDEIEIKPIKIKVEEARKKTPESESAATKSQISKSESKRVMIVDPTFSPESPTLLKQVEEEQSPQAEVTVKRPPKSSPLVYRSFYQPIVSKVRRPEGTKKAKKFLNYDWKNVSGVTPEGESPTEDSPVRIGLEKAKSSEGLSITDMEDIKDNNPDKVGVNASSIMLESVNTLSARLKRYNTSFVKKSNDDEGNEIIPSLRRSPSDYIKSRLAVEGRNKSVGKQKQVAFNF